MFACEAKSIEETIAALNNFGECLGFTGDRLCRSGPHISVSSIRVYDSLLQARDPILAGIQLYTSPTND